MELCMAVPHEYRGHLGEKVEVALLTFGATLVFAVAMLLRALWFPFGWLYRTIMR